MSIQQRENLDAILRHSAFPAVSDVNEQRRQLRELLSAQPLPARLSRAGEVLVTFEEYIRHIDWPLTVLSASFVLRAS